MNPFREWVNLHSFTARIHGRNIFDERFAAVRILRDAFENAPSKDADLQKCRVDVAAQHMIYDCSQLLPAMREETPSDGERRALKSATFPGDATFSTDRWDL